MAFGDTDNRILFSEDFIFATFDDGSAKGLEVAALWEAPGQVINALTGALETGAPALLVVSGDVAEILRQGLLVEAAGRQWSVSGSRPDGSGLTRIELTEA